MAWYDVCTAERPPRDGPGMPILAYPSDICVIISGYFSTISVPGFRSQQWPGITGRSGETGADQNISTSSFIWLYIDTTIHRPRQLIQVHQKILLSSQLFTTDIKFPPSKVREYSRVCGRKRKFSQCFVNILKNTSIIEKYIIECWVFRLTDNNVTIFCDL